MNSQVIAAGIPKVTVAILGGYGDLGQVAAWRHGVCTNALTRKDHVQLPFFPGTGLLLSALSHENQRFARQFGLQIGAWYTCITGQHIR